MNWELRNKISGLYAIADSQWNPCTTLPAYVERLLRGGCRLIQLRMKGEDPQHVLAMATEIMKFKHNFDFTFIVNDHPQVACDVGADGVHVGCDDMAVVDIRTRFGRKLIVGYSASQAPETAMKAVAAGASYIAFGAIFPTQSKGPDHPVHGVGRLKEMVASLSAPVVAIGGITRKNIDDVVKTGVNSVAMITALSQAQDIEAETKWFAEHCREY